ncbi:MAG: ImmA/IrrE family metallo-endopeptidase [Caldilineaceae bacterium]|nr:ImmA/IrrE family metallo-endopeptidase [Caldilineaceae bacterium]
MSTNRFRTIRTEEDYQEALTRLDEIFDAQRGTPEREELEELADLIELYESKHHPIDPPDPISAIKFRMDQAGLKQRDLVPYIGSRSKVSEVLSGKRDITMSMARALHEHLGVPADVLLKQPGVNFDPALNEVDLRRFPWKAIVKRKWIVKPPNFRDYVNEMLDDLVRPAGGLNAVPKALFRENGRRLNANADAYAVRAWCWRVLGVANQSIPQTDYQPGTVTLGFMREVAHLSVYDDGPKRAQAYLAQHGIPLVIERHLPRTYLDGAALTLQDGRPVIALTLRYDRIDSFWFSLMHELAHVSLHLDDGESDPFLDDLSIRGPDPLEEQADNCARDALIPDDMWLTSLARDRPDRLAVYSLAQQAVVHPAIVAGRVRFERNNYRLLSKMVWKGKVSAQF